MKDEIALAYVDHAMFEAPFRGYWVEYDSEVDGFYGTPRSISYIYERAIKRAKEKN